MTLPEHVIDALAEVALDLAKGDPYGIDALDCWCVFCGEHGGIVETVRHQPDCLWVRANALVVQVGSLLNQDQPR